MFFWRRKSVEERMREVETEAHRWARKPEQVAVKMDAGDLQGVLKKKLLVDFGTTAHVIQRSKFVLEMAPGVHTVDSLGQRLRKLDFKSPSTVMLADMSEIELKFNFTSLMSSDDLPVSCAAYVVVSIDNLEKFFSVMLKDRDAVLKMDLEEELAKELRTVVADMVRKHEAKDLLAKLALRAEMDETLFKELGPSLERMGIELSSLRVLEFTCEKLEEIRRQATDVNLYDERIKLNSRLRELMNEDKVSEWRSENDFADAVKDAQHESVVGDLMRKEEVDELKRTFEANALDHDLARRQITAMMDRQTDLLVERAKAENDIQIGKMTEELVEIQTRQRQLKFEQDMAEERIRFMQGIEQEHEQDMQDLELAKVAQHQALEMREKKMRMDLAIDLEKKEAEANLALKRHQANLELLKSQPDITPEQLLTMGALANPDMAQTLVEKAKVDGKIAAERMEIYKEMMEKQEQSYKEFLDRFGEQQKHAMDAMKGRGGVMMTTPGGGVIAGGGGLAEDVSTILCAECNTDNPKDSNFCRKCGKKLR